MQQTFKQFLSEASVGAKPTFNPIQVEEAIDILNTHCKDALWMLLEDRPIARGDDSAHQQIKSTGFALVDTSATTRKSQNTTNHYTTIFDNHPDMKQYPKRSKSFIASTEYDSAEGHANRFYSFIIVPYDGVKIGVVNSNDMWDHEVDLFGMNDNLAGANNLFHYCASQDKGRDWNKWQTWLDYDEKLKNGDAVVLAGLNEALRRVGSDVSLEKCDNFLKEVFKAYSPYTIGFSCQTTKTLNHQLESEVWVGGQCMIISKDMWDKMKAEIKNDHV
jgi:hypothetical protein